MFKWVDDVLTILVYFIIAVLGISGLAVSFTFYPIITAVVLGLLAIYPFLPWLEKGLARLDKKLDEQLANQPPFSLKRLGNELKQAFKKGMGSPQ